MTDSLTLPATAGPGSPAERLAAECACHVFLSGSPGYAAGRVPWNVAVDQHPAAVARPTTVGQVADLVRATARHGLRLAPQGTGHGAGPLSGRDLSDVVLVRLDAWREVTVDPDRGIARAAAGAQWQDVVAAAAPHGLTPLHGSSPDVGVTGYTLGGGLSFYARQHGLACNALVGAEVVTASGEVLRVDADTHADLFWALRGGGGNFGIVTALEFRLLPIRDVVAGMLVWDISQAEPVLRRWVEWCAGAPDEVTTSLRFLRLPPLPQLPPLLRGRSLLVIDGAFLTSDAEAAALLAPLRELSPELDTMARVPAPSVLTLHMDPPEPTPAVSASALLRGLDESAITALVAQFGAGVTTSLLAVELRQLGGALARHPAGAGALARLDADYALSCVAVAATPALAAAGQADADRGVAALAAWSAPGQYLNFAERTTDPRSFFAADDWARLARLRSACDPTGLLMANQPIAVEI